MEIQLIFEGAIIPKVRPRVTANGTYLSENYLSNQEILMWELKDQWDKVQLETITKPVAISITFTGKHSRRSDIDNLSGSVLDAMVKAKILKNDNLMIVTKLNSELIYDKKTSPFTEIILQGENINIFT